MTNNMQRKQATSQADGDGGGAPRMGLTRRELLAGLVSIGAGLVGTTMSRTAGAVTNAGEIKVGFISPRSGNLGLFGQSDPYNLVLARQALAKGLQINGKTYKVTVLDRDSQSSPSRASQLANELITKDHVQFMLCTSTPEVVNPVSDACEAAEVPCIGTDCPLESFFFGRGGKAGQPSPFKWTFDFSFGIHQFANAYVTSWPELNTNKKVAVLYPNDADGTAFRNGVAPYLTKHGFTVVDPGGYQDGTTDYSAQIGLFKREKCEIFNTVGIPDDVNTFWRQAAQLHLAQNIIIAEFAKDGQYVSQIAPLGVLANNIANAAFWTPVFPYKSPLTGMSSRQLADGYEKASGHQWTQQLGASMALLEIGVEVLKRATDPTDRAAIRDVIPKLDMVTTLGRVDFAGGPYPNTATTPMIACQYVKAAAGSKYPMDLVTVGHANDPNVPIQRKLVPYNMGQ